MEPYDFLRENLNACNHHTGSRVLTMGVGVKQQGLFNGTLKLLYVVYMFPNALTDKVLKPSFEVPTERKVGRSRRG